MNKRFRGAGFYILLLAVLIIAMRFFSPPAKNIPTKSFSEFITELQDGEIKSVVTGSNRVYKVQKKGAGSAEGEVYTTKIPVEAKESFYKDYLATQVENNGLEVISEKDAERSIFVELIPNILILVVFIFFWYSMVSNAQGGGKMNSFGKSKAKMLKDDENKKPVTFNDVAGLNEEKEELLEIVDFLKDPRKFVKMGARIPKGVLLVGPPGTGKTYLSKAVAGEARVPFFIMSGSDFVEMFVGVGASRVRDLFETAKKNAPCIIFIDEIDAVGRKRGAGLGGGHDEREQTLNQLLVEMDGFGTNEGVIVMAATNRADILDPALLRPGRFDRTVYVGRPDVKGREEILKVHSRNKPISPEVDLKVIAKRTPGFTPADLENLMNESALLAARDGRMEITMEDIEEAALKVSAGPAKKSKVVSEKERKLTAVHEAGHAVVSNLIPDHDPVHMITIIPRGMAGGFTAYIPEDDVDFMTKGEMKNNLISLLGGRVAEELVLDDISTGASNDIERASKIARAMVTQYGMSKKLGTITYGADEDEIFIGRDWGKERNYSENTAALIDEEVHELVTCAYNEAKRLLTENMDLLIRVSDALLEKETLNREEFEKICRGEDLEKSDYDSNDTLKVDEVSEAAESAVKELDERKSQRE